MKALALYASVILANASILILEISGARILAPHLGTSTEVWSGIIAVILGSLAIGYWIGGRLATSNLSHNILALLLLVGGLLSVAAALLREIVPEIIIFLPGNSLTLYAVSASAILFGPASIALGAVSPYATRLAFHTLDEAAPAIGKMGAIGTLGAILGSILAGAVLIPLLGLKTILFGTGAVLIGAALSIGFFSNTFRASVASVFLLAYALPSSLFALRSNDSIADFDTAYGRVWIHETILQGKTLRYIKTDPMGIQCGMFHEEDVFDTTSIAFPYVKGFFISDYISEREESVLMLGGCNYSHPRHYLSLHPSADITVVELDPGMTEIAKKWFGLSEMPGFSITHADARVFLNKNEKKYNKIFVDVFNSHGSIPAHLTTKEAAQELAKALTSEGMVIANIIGPLAGDTSLFTAALYKTWHDVFNTIAVYKISGTQDTEIQNLIFIGTTQESPNLPKEFSHQNTSFMRIENPVLEKLYDTGFVLTDEYAPAENLTSFMRNEQMLPRFRKF